MERSPVGLRHVLLLAAGVVLAVVAVARLTAFVPPLDELLGFAPVVIVGLLIATAGLLLLALRPRRDRRPPGQG